MPSLRRVAPLVFKQQPDVALDQANPVSGTKYEVLAETKNVRLISVTAICTWTVQPTPIEIHITIDGQVHTHYFNDPESAKPYYVDYAQEHITSASQVLGGAAAKRAFLRECRSVKVEAEITGGTVSNLSARVKYAKIP